MKIIRFRKDEEYCTLSYYKWKGKGCVWFKDVICVLESIVSEPQFFGRS
jgi:hypothetical protein